MKQNLSRMHKMSRVATWAVYALMAWVVWMIVCTIWQFFKGGVAFGMEGGRSMYVLLTMFNLVFYTVVLAVLWLGARLLATARAEAGPFTTANVKRLKGMGLLLVGMELLEMVLAPTLYRYVWHWDETARFDYALMTGGYISNAMGGLIIAIGLVVYCLALVFEYGVALQRQDDETL